MHNLQRLITACAVPKGSGIEKDYGRMRSNEKSIFRKKMMKMCEACESARVSRLSKASYHYLFPLEAQSPLTLPLSF